MDFRPSGTYCGPLCPRCGRVARSSVDVDVPVVNADTGRNLRWTRTVRRYEHEDRTCELVITPRIPISTPPRRSHE